MYFLIKIKSKIQQEQLIKIQKKKINSGNLNINNSKLLLKKNKTQNISALNFIENNQQQNNILNNILKKNSGSAYELLNNGDGKFTKDDFVMYCDVHNLFRNLDK